MLPPKKNFSSEQRDLLALYQQLPADRRRSLLDYARYLAIAAADETAQTDFVIRGPEQPVSIVRPEKESVVGAIRRMARTYPMLNKDELLHQASKLMGEHVLHGRPSADVIDQLEALFADAYAKYAASLETVESN